MVKSFFHITMYFQRGYQPYILTSSIRLYEVIKNAILQCFRTCIHSHNINEIYSSIRKQSPNKHFFVLLHIFFSNLIYQLITYILGKQVTILEWMVTCLQVYRKYIYLKFQLLGALFYSLYSM